MSNGVNPAQVAAEYGYQDRVVLITNPATELIFPADARRVCVIFSTTGPDDVQLFFRPAINTQGALTISPGQNPYVMAMRDYGPIVQQEISALAFGAAGNATLSAFAVYKIGNP